MGVNVRHSAFLCPGQASQKVGMCKDIYELNDYAKDRIDSANDILGYDIKTIMFSGPSSRLLYNPFLLIQMNHLNKLL